MKNLQINLLAETDATFEPTRDWSNPPNVVAIIERRGDFHRFGLPIPKGGCSSTARTRFADQMGGVERSGRVIFHRTNGTRTHWRLSDAGDWRLRSLATGWRFADVVTAMLALQELSDCGCTNGNHVPD